MVKTRRNYWKWVFLLLAVVAVIRVVRFGFNLVQFGSGIALIRIEGAIDGSTLIPASSALDQLRAAEKDPQIKAVVLRINSPGGSAAASQELYNAVLRFRQRGIPVVASLGDIAASGGYYAASAADYIYANGSTITGSIGVIMQTFNFEELYRKLGIGVEVVKSGEFKDTGSSFRSLTETETELLSELINDAWDQFVEDVANARDLQREQVEAVADGRILTGRQALEAGLVDALGDLEDATQKAVELAGITGSYFIRTYQKDPSLLQRLLSTLADLFPKAGVSLRYQSI
ncbi:MAG: signal peptide peptidase SppA [Limnochordia bacterium]|jgi:protease-4|nr:signal peptide peptidase SppA [Bacillota bacterium]NLH30995.1 signal peptide peptidase SppA [Bacillota bacterium]HOB08834.1 signal peptide peptidase SppA [Limnochordia bacterium]HPZ30424.1 signal peptide peptidase SppA [Limnochordia bacterium]HQD70730.1 signal peptide peptidase SppA [Limnochordia bacterium]